MRQKKRSAFCKNLHDYGRADVQNAIVNVTKRKHQIIMNEAGTPKKDGIILVSKVYVYESSKVDKRDKEGMNMFFSQKRKAALAVAFICAVTAALGEAMKTVADKV